MGPVLRSWSFTHLCKYTATETPSGPHKYQRAENPIPLPCAESVLSISSLSIIFRCLSHEFYLVSCDSEFVLFGYYQFYYRT